MPSYSPNESTSPPLGLSPSSLQAYEERENSRITNIHWESTIEDREFDSDDNDTVSEGSYSSGDEEYFLEGCIFHFENQIPTKPKKRTIVPFWYDNEEPNHLAKIVNEYNGEMKTFVEDNICASLKDCRRLPNFIGRIKRIPVKSKEPLDEFTTLDEIEIFRRDIRPCGSTTTWIKSTYIVTSWNEDGMPDNFMSMSNKNATYEWKQRAIKSIPITYIYCLPVWQSKSDFQYSVEKEKHDVGYANQPFNYAPYIPKYLLAPEETDLDSRI